MVIIEKARISYSKNGISRIFRQLQGSILR